MIKMRSDKDNIYIYIILYILYLISYILYYIHIIYMIRRNLMFDKVSCLYLMQKIVSRVSHPADISFLGSNVKLFCP